MKTFRKGQLVSVWTRNSPRHKWLMEFSMVRLIQINGDSVLVQTSETGQQHRAPNGLVMQKGPTGFDLRGAGNWQREMRKAVLP